MKKDTIKDWDGYIFGYIETNEKTGEKTARSFFGSKILGYYKPKLNITTDFYGKRLSQGDSTVSLVITQGKLDREKNRK